MGIWSIIVPDPRERASWRSVMVRDAWTMPRGRVDTASCARILSGSTSFFFFYWYCWFFLLPFLPFKSAHYIGKSDVRINNAERLPDVVCVPKQLERLA
jgi:hypothetical protein